jgi:hypothetical protein
MIRHASPFQSQKQNQTRCLSDATLPQRHEKMNSTRRKELGHATINAIVKPCTVYLSTIVTILLVFSFVLSFMQYNRDDLALDNNLRFVYLQQKLDKNESDGGASETMKIAKISKINKTKVSTQRAFETINDDNPVSKKTNSFEELPSSPGIEYGGDGKVSSIENPYFGYKSVEEMKSRFDRFPSIQDRVMVYMSNWYLPPCNNKHSLSNLISFQEIDNRTNPSDWKIVYENGSEEKATLLIQEIQFNWSDSAGNRRNVSQRSFHLSDSTGNSQIHFMSRQMFEKCSIESCSDIKNSWYPVLDQINKENRKRSMDVPYLFQFGDHILSKAYSPDEHRFGEFPALPHLKKSRQSIKHEEIGIDNVSVNPRKKRSSCYKGLLLPAETIDGKKEYLQPSKYLHHIFV